MICSSGSERLRKVDKGVVLLLTTFPSTSPCTHACCHRTELCSHAASVLLLPGRHGGGGLSCAGWSGLVEVRSWGSAVQLGSCLQDQQRVATKLQRACIGFHLVINGRKQSVVFCLF